MKRASRYGLAYMNVKIKNVTLFELRSSWRRGRDSILARTTRSVFLGRRRPPEVRSTPIPLRIPQRKKEIQTKPQGFNLDFFWRTKKYRVDSCTRYFFCVVALLNTLALRTQLSFMPKPHNRTLFVQGSGANRVHIPPAAVYCLRGKLKL